MNAWTRWQDWNSLVLGGYLMAVSPFVGDASNGASMWIAGLLGGAIAVVASLSLANPQTEGFERASFVLGLVLFVAPWLFAYSDLEGAAANARMVGALTMIDSIWSGATVRRFHGRLQGGGGGTH